MKRTMLIMAALVIAVSGCAAREAALYKELTYKPDALTDVTLATDKAIVVVPFVDARKESEAASECLLWNLVPLVVRTTLVETHPELVYKTSGSCFRPVKMTGTLADAIPKLLAEQLRVTRRAPQAQYAEDVEGEGFKETDLVLRGTVVRSALTTKRYSYGLGPAAVVAYFLGAPMVRYSAWLEVDWQLFDANNKPVSLKKTASVETPIVQPAGLYCGRRAYGKNAPLGLYVAAVKAVNEKIARDLSQELAQ